MTITLDLSEILAAIAEVNGVNQAIQYILLTLVGLNAFTIALMLALIFAVVWGRH